jgi:tRNA(Ile)-lysidine synthase
MRVTDTFEARVLGSLAELLPDLSRAPLCVALSGGLDSTALLAVLAARGELRTRLRAVHVDHGLQARSGAWAAHCRALASRLRVPLEVFATRVVRRAGESPEAAARRVRYRILGEALRESEVLLTAHHADDQLETVLLQLLRGAGLPGLAAMPACAPFGRGRLARPLLELERSEIETWARGAGVKWVEDDSNRDERFDRNYLRWRVLPAVRARWPAAARSGVRSARHAAEAQRLLDELARADVERAADGAALSAARLRTMSPERRRNALRYWIAQSGHPLPDTRRLAQLAGPLLEARADANPQVLWRGTRVQRHADRVTLHGSAAAVALEPLEPLEWEPHTHRVLELPAGLGRLEVAPSRRGALDLEALPARVTVRLRRGGERLRPVRGRPTRTLKRLLQGEHVALEQRERVPLVFCGEQLLAVADLWVDARIQASAGSTRRARLIWHRA